MAGTYPAIVTGYYLAIFKNTAETSKVALDIVNVILDKLPELATCVNKAGNSALHEAALHNNAVLIERLVHYSLDMAFIQNNQGETAFDLCRDNSLIKFALMHFDSDINAFMENFFYSHLKEESSAPGVTSCPTQNKPLILSLSFLYFLKQQGLFVQPAMMEAPDFCKVNIDGGEAQAEALEAIWLLSSCQITLGANREINLKSLSLSTLGLLSYLSVEKIFVTIECLYPYFDVHQKIIMNYIIWTVFL